jgi:hypothetical protein
MILSQLKFSSLERSQFCRVSSGKKILAKKNFFGGKNFATCQTRYKMNAAQND